ncbi:MAG: MOSC domain-containing protein [Pseudomonadota bacterium]
MTKPFHIEAMYAGTPSPLGPRKIASAIVKSAMPGPWEITLVGLVGDAQADTRHHGGPEKALHHYAREHYATWQDETPALATTLATVPAFGENISTFGMTEASVCIGDIYRIGSVVVQVSQGRQPCWKLNARFATDDMAYRVQSTGRTGWYYRVLEPGAIEPGAAITLADRPQPDWPLSRICTLLYHRTTAFDELAALAELPELADSWRTLAARRVKSRTVESWNSRLEGNRS